MAVPRQPEVLPPVATWKTSRLGGGGRLFSDENLDILSHLLDDCFRIPGTEIRFGVEGIVGLVPAVGDVISGLASCILIFAAWVRGVPYVTLARMGVNLAIDVLVGAVPFLGDVFDIAWKANRRNYKLLTRHIEQPRQHTWKDWVFLLTLVAALTAVMIIPLVVLAWTLDWLVRHGNTASF
jgi:NAD/NADP transhydrogenase beta subunit